jgi:formylglycine-generating enzyme required for sulfatase activity
VDKAGGLSPYGVMGLGGNVREWEESSVDLANSSSSSPRGARGGSWSFGSANLSSSNRTTGVEFSNLGFRVAEVIPEPSMMVIGTLFGLGGLVAKRRRKK